MKNLFKVLIAVFVLITGFSCARVDRTSHKGGNNEENGAVRARQQEKTDDFVSADAPDENATSPIVHYGPKPTQTLHVFIENSGSMNGYINNASDFQMAIGRAIQLMKFKYEQENIKTYYINTNVSEKVRPANTDIYTFVQDMLERTEFTRTGGTASTDLNDIVKKVLGYVDENNTAILISDFIYSLPSTKGVTTSLLYGCQNLTMSAFLEKTKQLPKGVPLATNLVQLVSFFDGHYWHWEKPTGRDFVSLKCSRPYYMCVLGTDENVKDFNHDIDIESLKGYKNQFTISNKDVSKAKYTVLDTKYKKGSYRHGTDPNIPIHEITKAKANSVNEFELGVAIDLSDFSMSESDKLDVANYVVGSGNYKIERIEKIETSQLTNPTDVRLVRDFHCTHAIILSCTGFPNDLSISIKRSLPKWVRQSSSTDDCNIRTDDNEQMKTFGLAYFVDGIADAYKHLDKDKSNFMTINISVKSN